MYLNCELQSLMQYLEFTDARIRKRVNLTSPVDSNPLIVHDMVRCILCGRCIRACSELRGVDALVYVRKGENLMVGPRDGGTLVDAGCKFCGACVEVCPTGSIRDQLSVFGKYKNKKAALVPCRETCPAGIDIPRYVRYVKKGESGHATAVIREKVPFPATLGHICDHPCESDCRRGQVNESVAIRSIKRFAAEHDDGAWRDKGYRKAPTGKRVAVVGAGPAGLTAAYYLAKSGHQVTVLEELDQPGGMLRVGVPTYRLPREVLDEEIGHVRSVGVQIECGVAVGSVAELKKDGYDAVLIAVGTHQGVRLTIPGAESAGVLVSTEFLRGVNLGEPVASGERVLVLGGGNVAFDCAGVARRLGAKEVSLACLEPRDAMLASEEEIEEALAAGAVLYNSRTFDEIVVTSGKPAGVRCRKVMSCTFDENGLPDICVAEDSESTIPADTVIFAIGQRPGLTDAIASAVEDLRAAGESPDDVAVELVSGPFKPNLKGYEDEPTLVLNAETLLHVGRVLRDGADRYRQTGTPESPGSKLFQVCGVVNHTGIFELPLGITLRYLLDDVCKGITDGETLHAVIVGGCKGACFREDELDLALDFDSLKRAGGVIGSGGVEVLGERDCIVSQAKRRIAHACNVDCGKCSLGREGSYQLREIMTDMTRGKSRSGDLEMLREIGRSMQVGCACSVGRTAPNPILSALEKFPEEYEAHMKRRLCKALVCEQYVNYHILPDLCDGCGACADDCPEDAIEGGRRKIHVIDQDSCTKCGKCYEVCLDLQKAVVKAGPIKPRTPKRPIPVGSWGS